MSPDLYAEELSSLATLMATAGRTEAVTGLRPDLVVLPLGYSKQKTVDGIPTVFADIPKPGVVYYGRR